MNEYEAMSRYDFAIEPGVANPLSLGQILELVPQRARPELAQMLIGPLLMHHEELNADGNREWSRWGNSEGDGLRVIDANRGPAIVVQKQVADKYYRRMYYMDIHPVYGAALESFDSVSSKPMKSPALDLVSLMQRLGEDMQHGFEGEILLGALAQHPNFRSVGNMPLATVREDESGVYIEIQGECGSWNEADEAWKNELVREIGPFN